MPLNTTLGKYQIGDKFNHWTLLEAPMNNRHFILVRCDCGNEARRKYETIKIGTSTQCRACASHLKGIRHGACIGGRKNRLNSIWSAMRSRCSNPNGACANIYYNRGISVCKEWDSFIVFQAWSLENGYEKHLTLDRIDNDQGYSPKNCRWVTTMIQGRNKRSLIPTLAFGERKLLKDWAQDSRCVVCYEALTGRIRKGWPPELALTTPSDTVKNRVMIKRLM